MAAFNLISADSHIVEPPDLYRAALSRNSGTPHRVWSGTARARAGNTMPGTSTACVAAPWAPSFRPASASRNPARWTFLGLWEDVKKAAYEPEAMIEELEVDGVWGACLQPSQGCSGIALTVRTAPC